MSPRDIVAGTLLAALGIGGAAMIQVATTVYPHNEDLIFWIGCGLVAISTIGIALLLMWPRKNPPEASEYHPVIKIGHALDSSFDQIEGNGPILDIGKAEGVSATRLRSKGSKDGRWKK